MTLSRFESCPVEVFQEIVLWLVANSFLGPPTDIPSLLLVSRHVQDNLSARHNPYLYACIFSLKFDVRAPVVRLGGKSRHLDLTNELVKRFEALKRVKNDDYTHTHDARPLNLDLWTAYCMFLESDNNNSRQLIEYAKVDRFAFNFVSLGGLLHSGADVNRGWTVDNEENALALWLFWFTDKQRVLSETPIERRQILQALAHLFVGSFKYASAYAPITSFRIPPASPPPPPPRSLALPLAASPISPPCLIPCYFGLELTLARPLLMPPALLSCVARLEVAISEMDLPLPDYVPTTRTDAIAAGWNGPTVEDHIKIKEPTTRLVDWDNDMSRRHHYDWMRLRSCYSPWSDCILRRRMFTPGSLDGVWNGRWFGIPVNQFMELLLSEQTDRPIATSHPPLVYPAPMQFRLREHHQRDPNGVVDFDDISHDGTGKGVFNAWLPEGTAVGLDDLEVHVRDEDYPYKYQSYRPLFATSAAVDLDEELSHEHEGTSDDDEVLDIILTAETDGAFATAWGHKRYYGRVRTWDGLIVLVREATETEGQWIFRGYLHGMQNLVGLWRETGTPVSIPAWEGVWSMTKMGE